MNVVRLTLRVMTLAGRAAIAGAVGYLTILTVAAWGGLARRRAPVDTSPQHRYAVLVPAHDEELLIASTVASLRAMDYPSELFEVHVVADNCNDATAANARAAGAVVHERLGLPGKGPALEWLVARLRAGGNTHDALVFLDADTIADPGFLRAVDVTLKAGASVVQGHYAVRDEGSTPVVAFRAAALAARNFLRPLGRVMIGGTAGLYGNGMVFRADLMSSRSFSDHLTEDAELQLQLLEEGIKVSFQPAARIEAEMPSTLEAARSQHERWEGGRLDLARRHLPALVRRSVVGGPAGRVAYADAAFDQAVPPFSVVVAGSWMWFVAALVRWAQHPSRGRRRELGLSAALGAAQAVYVLSALRMVRAPSSVYRALGQAPRMVLWKLRLWFTVLGRGRPEAWVRTARNDPSRP